MSTTTTNDKERIDAIPPRAAVLGIDAAGRPHLFAHGDPLDVWVLDPDATAVAHHEAITTRPLSAWVGFVADRCGWDVRHRIEDPPFTGLLEAERTPPTRAELLG